MAALSTRITSTVIVSSHAHFRNYYYYYYYLSSDETVKAIANRLLGVGLLRRVREPGCVCVHQPRAARHLPTVQGQRRREYARRKVRAHCIH